MLYVVVRGLVKSVAVAAAAYGFKRWVVPFAVAQGVNVILAVAERRARRRYGSVAQKNGAAHGVHVETPGAQESHPAQQAASLAMRGTNVELTVGADAFRRLAQRTGGRARTALNRAADSLDASPQPLTVTLDTDALSGFAATRNWRDLAKAVRIAH